MEPSAKNQDQNRPNYENYYFSTDDLVIIALFSALGGISSSFIANIIRTAMGIPGGGQLGAGIHIFWYVLIYYLLNGKIGAVTLAGVLKGFVELFTGNSIGIIAIVVAFGGAIIFEAGIYVYKAIIRRDDFIYLGIISSAGLAAASNILIQLELFIDKDIPLFLFFAFISGMLLGGVLGSEIFNIFDKTGILDWRKEKN
jgi:energy-coupling factor transport system substrate-specific component